MISYFRCTGEHRYVYVIDNQYHYQAAVYCGLLGYVEVKTTQCCNVEDLSMNFRRHEICISDRVEHISVHLGSPTSAHLSSTLLWSIK